MPEEDVIAQLLFDQNLQGLTPLQAVQMAGAVATLIGRGDGVVARIRTRFGLDNLDVQSDPDGATALKMGKYVSDKVYSELSVDSKGMQVLDFSMDVTRNLKLRAGAGSTGNVGIGFELETNY
jgi:translocation and assembly module TamB